MLFRSVSLLGSSFVAIFHPGQDQSPESQRQEVLENEYIERQATVQRLTEIVEGNPDNIEAHLELADAYFDKSRVTGQLNYSEYEEDLQKATELYQVVLRDRDNNDIMLKLATSAFLLGETDLADETYIELLTRDPQNIDALYGHGLLLFYLKEDYTQAEAKWQEALLITTDEQMKVRLEEMISVVQTISSNTSEVN